jgi:hypothetical protein
MNRRSFTLGKWAVAVCCLSLAACADRRPPLRLPGIDLYSRNGIVCLPTGIGNVACGLPGWILATPFGAVCASQHEFCEQDAVASIGVGLAVALIWTPAYLCGAATGSLFIPFSYLADENPCSFM